jgi:hypothetical protein
MSYLLSIVALVIVTCIHGREYQEMCSVVLIFCKHQPVMREQAIVQGLLGNSDLDRWETVGGQFGRLNWVTHGIGLVAAWHRPQMPTVSLVKVAGGANYETWALRYWVQAAICMLALA